MKLFLLHKFISRRLLLSVIYSSGLFTCCYNTALAQAEDNIWVFGDHAALDLNPGTPVSLTGYSNNAISVGHESSASISDKWGNILFYTNSESVWNKVHAVMPNGAGLATLEPETSTQGSVISKYPGSDSLYYLFTIDARGHAPGYLRYNIIDMSLDGGNGDIIATEKNVVLDSMVHEKMTITRDEGCYYWLVAYSDWEQEYRSFRITETGIEPAVISSSPLPNLGLGELKISPDGTRLANTSYMPHVEMANFDKSTGIVSGFMSIDLSPNTHPYAKTYGCSFSPGSSKLYISNEFDIIQFDLTSWPSEAGIESSLYKVATLVWVDPQLRLAGNGKIYFPDLGVNTINVINNPELAGAACSPTLSLLTLPAGSTTGFGIGSSVIVNDPIIVTPGTTDSFTYCYVDSQKLVAPYGYDVYVWDDGSSGQTRTVYGSGTYWVKYGTSCHQTLNTFHVTIVSDDIFIHNDPFTTACWDEVIDLVADDVPGYTYEWSPAARIADPSSPITTMIATNTVVTLKVGYPGCPDFYRLFNIFAIDCFPMGTIAGAIPLGNIQEGSISGSRGGFNMTAYPNPAYDHVTIKIEGQQGTNAAVAICDLPGRILKSQVVTGPETRIDMSNLVPGMYFIKYTDDLYSKTISIRK